jgi:hypothetical protein
MADKPHNFHSTLLIDGMPIGQIAYEAFVTQRATEPYWSGPSLRWGDLTPARQQTWDAMADALITTYETLGRPLD